MLGHFLHDLSISSSDSDFLKNYCGIDLDNEDTGAITGYDAGGTTVKTSVTIVPEDSLLDTSFSSDNFTVNSLYVYLNEGTSGGKTFSELTTTEQFIFRGLETWWVKNSLDLIADSYGSNYSFTDDSSVHTNNYGEYDTRKIGVNFYNDSSSSALASVSYQPWSNGYVELSLNINMNYYGNISTTDVNGYTSSSGAGYLDRILAHEFTHAVMAANITNMSLLPTFIVEGMAELTHGIDDYRKTTIKNLLKSENLSRLQTALSMSTSYATGDDNYAAGYMFLRYLAEQANSSDNSIIYGTEANDNNTNQGKGKDKRYYSSITNTSNDKVIYSLAGNDKVVNSGSNVTIVGGAGNDTLNLNGSNQIVGYSDGDGKDVVAGFGASDSISIGAGVITTSALKKDNVVLTIGKGNITLNDAKDQFIKIIDADGKLSTRMYGKGTITVQGSSDSETLTAWAKADSLNGGEGNDTLIGGKGADTLTGGSGADKFYYTLGDGADVITDYTANEDVIVLDDTTVTKVAQVRKSESDLLFTVKKGSIRVNNGAGNRITFRDTSGNIILNQTFGSPYIYISNGDYSTVNTAIDASVITLDSSYRTSDVMLIGNAQSNYIRLGSGNETVTTGKGKDTVEYLGGNVVITDYTAGSDVIKLTNSDIVSAKLDSGNNSVVFTLKDTGTTTTSTLTLQNMVKKKAVQKVTVIDKDGISYSQVFGSPTLTIANTDGDTVIANSDVTVMNASKRSKSVYLVGNEFANTIRGGSKADTIEAGLGNDSITGGKGDDIFIFSGGKDTIADYSVAKNNTDSIQIADLTFDTYYVDGKNVIMTFKDTAGTTRLQESDTSLTILNGKDKSITVGSDTKVFNDYYEKIFVKKDTDATYNAAGADDSLHTVKLIDASKKASSIYIIGNNFSDGTISTIKGGTKADTIQGGTGDDILTGGGGADLFIYAEGNDTITDYVAGTDVISFSSGTNLVSAAYNSNGSDLEFTTNKGILTIKNAIKKKKDQKISVLFGTNKISQIYGRDSLTVAATDGDTVDLRTSVNSGVTVVNASGRAAKNPIVIYGNAKANTLAGSKGTDIIYGGTGDNNSISGGAGNDTLNGGTGNNITLNGGAGNDSLNGGSGITFFDPGAGDDVINISTASNRGKATITYTAGKDNIVGYKVGDEINLAKGVKINSATKKNDDTYTINFKGGTLDITLSGDTAASDVFLTTAAATQLAKGAHKKGGTGSDSDTMIYNWKVDYSVSVSNITGAIYSTTTLEGATDPTATKKSYEERFFDEYTEAVEIFDDTVLSTAYELEDITSPNVKGNVISIDYDSPIKGINMVEFDISDYVDEVDKNKS